MSSWRGPAGPQAVGPAWRIAATAIALGVLAPVVSLAWLALGSGLGHWSNLLQNVLPQAALNTAVRDTLSPRIKENEDGEKIIDLSETGLTDEVSLSTAVLAAAESARAEPVPAPRQR